MKRTLPKLIALGMLLLPLAGFAISEGFQDRYTAEVDGQTWVLYIDNRRSFPSMLSAKLQMGETLNRYILLGSIENQVVTGTYKALRAAAMAEEKPFSLRRTGDASIELALENRALTMTADTSLAPVDDAIIGTWSSEPKIGSSSSNPYLGKQWSIHFRADGTACEATRMVDSRGPVSYQDPCARSSSQRWKAENGKIHYADDSGDWQMQFNYRIMGGRLVVSYPDGSRVVTNPANPTRVSAQ